MSAAGKKKKKKADEEAAEVNYYALQQNSYLMTSVTIVFKHQDSRCLLTVQEENEREVPISEMDLLGVGAMNSAYLICHNVQVCLLSNYA